MRLSACRRPILLVRMRGQPAADFSFLGLAALGCQGQDERRHAATCDSLSPLIGAGLVRLHGCDRKCKEGRRRVARPSAWCRMGKIVDSK
jgi:hypothetical protein